MQLITVTLAFLYQTFQSKLYQKAHNPAKNSDILIMPNYHKNAKRPRIPNNRDSPSSQEVDHGLSRPVVNLINILRA
jgi:hypothetical protein